MFALHYQKYRNEHFLHLNAILKENINIMHSLCLILCFVQLAIFRMTCWTKILQKNKHPNIIRVGESTQPIYPQDIWHPKIKSYKSRDDRLQRHIRDISASSCRGSIKEYVASMKFIIFINF